MKTHSPSFGSGTSVIEYPNFQHAYSVLEHFFHTSSTKPRALLIVGPPGAGKSYLLETFLREHPVEDTDEMTRVPALCIEAPPENTVSGLLGDLLEEMGDPVPDSCAIRARRSRLTKLIKQQGTKIAFIDEAQDLTPKSGADAKSKNIKLLKHLMNATNIPFVLTGTMDAVALLKADTQLRGRIKDVVTLPYFDCMTPDNALDFADYIQSLLTTYPRTVRGFSFCKEDEEKNLVLNKNIKPLIRLALATDGCQRRIHDLFERVLHRTSKDEVVKIGHLAESWNMEQLLTDDLSFNPLDTDVAFAKVREEAQYRGLYDSDNF